MLRPIDLSDLTCLVGTNGSGKSAVLTAISKMLGLSEAECAIVKSDFRRPQVDEEETDELSLTIEVRIEFPELDGDDDSISLSDHPKPANEGHLKTGQR